MGGIDVTGRKRDLKLDWEKERIEALWNHSDIHNLHLQQVNIQFSIPYAIVYDITAISIGQISYVMPAIKNSNMHDTGCLCVLINAEQVLKMHAGHSRFECELVYSDRCM